MNRPNSSKRHVQLATLGIAALTSLLLISTVLAAGTYDLPWFTIPGGGGLASSGSSYTLSGSVAEVDASEPLSGAQYSVTGGFWAGQLSDLPVLPAPTDLVAVANGPKQIDLTWTDNSNNESGFKIERSLAGTGSWMLVDTTAADATSYADTGVDCETGYDYRVIATNPGGDSSPSNIASATTDTCLPVPEQPVGISPTGFITTPTPAYSWYEVADATQYQLQVNDTGGVVLDETYDGSTVCSGGVCSVTPATSLADGGYDWQIRASNASETGPWSDSLAFFVDTAAPSNPSTMSSTSHVVDQVSNITEITVTWSGDADDGSGSGVAGYSILWDNDPSGEPDEVPEFDASHLTETSPTLADGTWYFHLRTCDEAGNCAEASHSGPYIIDSTVVCHTLTLDIRPANGGSVSPSLAPNCNGSTQYIHDTVVSLLATANEGYNFSTWGGDISGKDNPIDVLMDGDKNVISVFVLAPIEDFLRVGDVEIIISDTLPVEVVVQVNSYLPDSCTRFDRVEQSRDGNDIVLQIFTTRPADIACAQKIKPFSKAILLEGDFPPGDYVVTINGKPYPFTVP